MADLKAVADALIEGDDGMVGKLVEEALEENVPPREILKQGLIAGMDVVGQRFRDCEFFLPEVLLAAQAMYAGLNILRPILSKSGEKTLARIVIGTVKGDLHDIGKNLVKMMLEGAGFHVVDLGVDVPPEKFLEAVKEEGTRIVGMSALLTTTMESMGKTLEALREAGIRDQVKVIVGGAPLDEEFAGEIGADGYAPDAASAVIKVKELLGM